MKLKWPNTEKILDRKYRQGQAEGKAEGKAEGIEIGRAEGRAEGKAEGIGEVMELLSPEEQARVAQLLAQQQKDG